MRQLVAPTAAGVGGEASPYTSAALSAPSEVNSVLNSGSSPGVAISPTMAMDVDVMGKAGDQPQGNGEANADVMMPLATGGKREERSKKSLAYRHTEFHRLLEDSFGNSYERRMCSYCDAVFSFKGGTTSAALRHLKTAHPDRVLYGGGVIPAASTGATPPTGDGGRSVGGEFSAMLNAEDSSAVAQSASASVLTATNAVQAENDNDPADETEEVQMDTEATASLPSKVRTIRSNLKRKRDNDVGEEEATATVGESSNGDSRHAASSKGNKSPRGQPPKLTASQTAILHFLHHHIDELPLPTSRLRFAKHLTHNVEEAEMYNVLDAATQLEYIREFAQQSGVGTASHPQQTRQEGASTRL
ncbi:hypothetical protein BBJ28_00000597 [Nothophytophthora sp. Chile5]|nr:hypothetical protein BBJ28_00000597 [Nothophytophthora sp. Chile5]